MPVGIPALVLGAILLPKIGEKLIDRGQAMIEEHLPAAKERLGGILDFLPGGGAVKEEVQNEAVEKERRRAAPELKSARRAAEQAKNAVHAANQKIDALKNEMAALKKAGEDLLAKERDLSKALRAEGKRDKKAIASCRREVSDLRRYQQFAKVANSAQPPQGAAELYAMVNEGMTAPGAQWPDGDIYAQYLPSDSGGVAFQAQGAFSPLSLMSPLFTGTPGFEVDYGYGS